MKYRKIEVGPYNLHIIKTDKFKTVTVRINFKRPLIKEEITKRNLLVDVLASSTNKFKTEKMMNIETEELYGLSYGSSRITSGKYSIMTFDMCFINDKYLPESIFNKAINFMMDILFNQNEKDGKFDEKIFEINKDNLIDEIKSFEDNPRKYSLVRLYEIMGENNEFGYRGCGYLDDAINLTNEELYNYYQNVLKSDIVDIFVLGDVDADEIKNIFKNNFKINTIKKKQGSHYIKHDNIRKRSRTKIEEKDINQSKLVIGCKLNNLSDYETNYVSNIYSFILGGGPDSLLFQNLREKNSLCYYVSSNVQKVNNLLVVESGIDGKDYKKAIKIIKKEIKNMMLGNFSDDLLNNGIKTYLSACKSIDDSPNGIINVYASKEYLNMDLLDKRQKEIIKVTREDVMELAKKVYLDTIYLLKAEESLDE